MSTGFSHGVASVVACGSVFMAFLISVFLFFNLVGAPEDERVIQVLVFDWIKTGNFSHPSVSDRPALHHHDVDHYRGWIPDSCLYGRIHAR